MISSRFRSYFAKLYDKRGTGTDLDKDLPSLAYRYCVCYVSCNNKGDACQMASDVVPQRQLRLWVMHSEIGISRSAVVHVQISNLFASKMIANAVLYLMIEGS